MSSTFESLKFHNYRIWFFAALITNTGTWMQRVAQDWLVLRILTDDSAAATGTTTALQFLPALLLSAHAGVITDRVDQRKFLMITQTALGVVSALLTVDVLAGRAQLWHVYLAALATGVVSAYDAPARQIFVARMVPSRDLANAVGLNSASFNAARLLGPAAAGLVIAWAGAGWVFLVNALTFLFPTLALATMRVAELYDVPRAARAKGQVREGLAYVRHRGDIMIIIVVISLVSMLTLNFQVTMAAMVRSAFDLESDAYGTVSSVFAVGSLTGALWAARRRRPRVRTVVVASFLLGGLHPGHGGHAGLPAVHGLRGTGRVVRAHCSDRRQSDGAADHRSGDARSRHEPVHDVPPGHDADRRAVDRMGLGRLGAAHGPGGGRRCGDRRLPGCGRVGSASLAREPCPLDSLSSFGPPGRRGPAVCVRDVPDVRAAARTAAAGRLAGHCRLTGLTGATGVERAVARGRRPGVGSSHRWFSPPCCEPAPWSLDILEPGARAGRGPPLLRGQHSVVEP